MPHNSQHMSEQMEACIQECENCHDVCVQTIQHCLQMGGEHASPEHISLLQACAEICSTSADFMLMGSEYHGLTCGVCAQVCDACAESCESFEGDEMMAQCAESCRSCAESCREMEAMAPVKCSEVTE